MTETGMNTSNPLTASASAGTVGFPLPGVEARVAGDDGREAAARRGGRARGHAGRTCSRATGGCRRRPRRSSAPTASSSPATSARIDEDGRVAIVGRAKDLIISGGLNVYPKEIEALIDELPGVEESAVIGVPHPDFGEGVAAVVVPDGTAEVAAEAVRALLKDKLAAFKQPKEVVFVDELPRNTMGKVQKNQLRDRYQTLYSA